MSSSALVDGVEKIRFTAREVLYSKCSHAFGVGRHRTYERSTIRSKSRFVLPSFVCVVVVVVHNGKPWLLFDRGIASSIYYRVSRSFTLSIVKNVRAFATHPSPFTHPPLSTTSPLRCHLGNKMDTHIRHRSFHLC